MSGAKVSWRTVLPPAALLSYGLAVAFWPMLASGFALMEVDPADTRHLNYVLEHGHRFLSSGGQLPLWSPAFFFPERNVAAYTELLLGVVPFYSAWRLVGFAPDTSFQLWMITVMALNFAAGWALFRRALAFDVLPAALGTFIVSFGGARLSELNHQHLLPHFFTLIALFGLVRLFSAASPVQPEGSRGRPWPSGPVQPELSRGRPWPSIALFFAGLVLQLYAGVTMGWFLLFALALAAVWALSLSSTRPRLLGVVKANWRSLLIGGVLSAVALAPLAGPYLAAGRAVGVRSFNDAVHMMPQVHSWLYEGPHSWLYGWMADLPLFSSMPGEGAQRIGLGLVTTAVVVFVFWRERSTPWMKVLGLTALTVVLLVTLYRGRVSPWQAVMAWVPGANGIRAVGRVAILLLIPAGVALGTFLQRAEGPRRWLVLAIAGFCVLEQGRRVPDTYDKAAARADVAAVVARIDPSCHSFFYAPVRQPKYPEKTQVDAMWAQLETGVPTVNGYSSNFPRGWDLFEHGLDDEAAQAPALKEKLAAWANREGLDPASICFVTVTAR